MKTKAFLPVVVSSLVVEDSSALLALSQATASNLMAAVGHRNVTTMQALVQDLAEESVNEPGWKFSPDIRHALEGIRGMFVSSIQNTLNKEHREDQIEHNFHTKDCFGGCVDGYKKGHSTCDGDTVVCDAKGESHRTCRLDVYMKYKDMGKKCGKLHCFEIDDIDCKGEYCTAPPVDYCHEKTIGAYGTECIPHATKYDAEIKSGGFPEKDPVTGVVTIVYSHVGGRWLQHVLEKFKGYKKEWDGLYKDCSKAYKLFLEEDRKCDLIQKDFEKCMCDKEGCQDRACNVDYSQCEDLCWKQYEEKLQQIECREKDRKIDWSATKKIECYVDVLLHNYTRSELKSKCGDGDNCINKLREEDYKKCASICPHIDYDGDWPEVDYSNYEDRVLKPTIDGFNRRAAHEHDEYHLGDGDYDTIDGESGYDLNGDLVFTKHRSPRELTSARHAEGRCTEHLDIDYQIPLCMECAPTPPPVCDCEFAKEWYHVYVPDMGREMDFDDPGRIGCISDCCAEPKTSSNCFDDVDIKSCWGEAAGYSPAGIQTGWTRPSARGVWSGYPKNDDSDLEGRFPDPHDFNTEKKMPISEHSHAWAFNRCDCTPCSKAPTPAYGARPEGRQCGNGPHTFSRTRSAYDLVPSSNADKDKVHEYKKVCIGAKGGNFGSIDFKNWDYGLGKEHGQSVSGNDVCIERITFTHVSGSLSCRKQESGDSNWGCDERSIGLVLTDNSDTLIAPAFDTAVGMTPEYKKHAPWYKMNGVQHDSKQMELIFKQPFLFGSGEYKLWYGEDLTGGTEGDNRGEACFDVAFERAKHPTRCHELPPLQFHEVCVSAAGDKPHTVTLPENTFVTEIAVHLIDGSVSCRKAKSGDSGFGCDSNKMLGLVLTKHGEKEVIFPQAGLVEGYKKINENWYKIEGVNKDSRTLPIKLTKTVQVGGSFDLWYNEDLTGSTESDNRGTACYEVTVHRAA